MKISEDTYVYFVYSATQYDKQKEISEKLGKPFEKKYVITQGKAKLYTDIVTNLDNCKFSDSITINQGILKDIKYYTR